MGVGHILTYTPFIVWGMDFEMFRTYTLANLKRSKVGNSINLLFGIMHSLNSMCSSYLVLSVFKYFLARQNCINNLNSKFEFIWTQPRFDSIYLRIYNFINSTLRFTFYVKRQWLRLYRVTLIRLLKRI